jgi:hypothetical protein
MMKTTPLTAVLAAALAMTAGPAALGQPYDPEASQRYQEQQSQYQDAQADYQSRQRDYQRQQEAYRERREAYEQARADYDARYGYGAYARRYGSFESRYPAYDASDYGRDVGYNDYYAPYRNSPCEQRRSDRQVAGGLIGALAGAAIGSNIGGHGARTEGAVLGAVAGGLVGANIGRSSAQCDNVGYYYRYDQTYPYRESSWDRRARSGRYDYRWYSSRRCRLAVAPTQYGDDMDYRYVRVCPDGSGRYRITG